MSSPGARTAADAGLRARLEVFYTSYYRDTLGIPGWRELVAVRLSDDAHEAGHVTSLERALGTPVRGRRLLNVGCGTGGFNVAARRAGADVWGIDASAEAAALTAARVPEARTLRATAEALPLASASFDVVYCFSTLEHVADARAAVREMVRVLRPGGRLYLHTPHRWSLVEGHYKMLWIPGLPRWLARAYVSARGRPSAFLGTLRLLTPAQCRRYLEEAGARVVRIVASGGARRVGGALGLLLRLYGGLLRIQPSVEIVAARREDP